LIPKEKTPEGRICGKENGCSRLRGMGSSEQDSWYVGMAKFLAYNSLKVLLHLSMMYHSESS
jgi:hypothetical protein